MKKNIELYTTGDRDLDEHNAKALIIMWNAAIEAAVKELNIINDLGGAFLVRKLKK